MIAADMLELQQRRSYSSEVVPYCAQLLSIVRLSALSILTCCCGFSADDLETVLMHCIEYSLQIIADRHSSEDTVIVTRALALLREVTLHPLTVTASTTSHETLARSQGQVCLCPGNLLSGNLCTFIISSCI